eukprot:2629494-Pyramimonas_sp.AAC.1
MPVKVADASKATGSAGESLDAGHPIMPDRGEFAGATGRAPALQNIAGAILNARALSKAGCEDQRDGGQEGNNRRGSPRQRNPSEDQFNSSSQARRPRADD